MARGKVCDFAFLTSSGGGGGGKFYEFFITFGLAIPPLTVKNRGDALIWDHALNRANTVRYLTGSCLFDCDNIPLSNSQHLTFL